MRPIPTDAATTLGAYRRHPGCRLRVACAACGWAKEYNPERVVARLHELREAPLGDGAARTVIRVT